MKQYNFTEEELIMLREATREYLFFLKNADNINGHTTDKRKRNIDVSWALFEQFRDDIICL